MEPYIKNKLRKKIADYFSNNPSYNKQYCNTVLDEKFFFGNYPGLRLTYNGFYLMKQEFEYWQYQIDTDVSLSVMEISKLNQKMNSVYYLVTGKPKHNHISLFAKDDYATLLLIEDFKGWIQCM